MNIAAPSQRIVVLPGTSRSKTNRPPPPSQESPRDRMFGFLPSGVRNHFIAWLGEFVGTFMFLLLAYAGTQVANTAALQESGGSGGNGPPDAGTLLYIALAFGFSLAVNVWVFFRVSGGLFNPAVTLGMALIGAISWIRAMIITTAQLLGAIVAAGVTRGLFPGPLLVATSLSAQTSVVRGFFIEMLLTAELGFTIFMLAAEKHKGTYLAPVGIGLALFIAELAGVYYTGGSLNPARSFAPAVILQKFPGYHWIYWAAPIAGTLLAVVFYRLVKFLEYETANPGQDDDHEVVPDENTTSELPARTSQTVGPSDRDFVVVKPAAPENNGDASHFSDAGVSYRTGPQVESGTSRGDGPGPARA